MASDTSKKDPAFLLYSKDWLQGTGKLFPAEKGVFIDLLCHHHQDGFLPLSTKRLAKLAGISEDEFLPIWAEIKDKFFEKDGFLYNKKLMNVVENRVEHGEMRTIIGTFGQLLKATICSEAEKAEIRKKFNYEDYIGTDKANLSNLLSKYISNCLSLTQPIHGTEDAIGIKDVFEESKGGEGGNFLPQDENYIVPEMLAIYKKSNPNHPASQGKDFVPLKNICLFINAQSGAKGDFIENKALVIKKWEQLCSVIAEDGFYKIKTLSVISNHIQEIYQIQQNGRPQTHKPANGRKYQPSGTGGY